MTSSTPQTIRTQADLTSLWEALLSPDSGEPPSLCVAFFDPDGGRPPAMLCVDDVPASPQSDDGSQLARGLARIQHEVGLTDAAAAVVRGGHRDVTDGDRAWARCLTQARAFTGRWPLHLVTPSGARVLAVDDVLGPAAG